MAKKLSKAQERVLDGLRRCYDETLESKTRHNENTVNNWETEKRKWSPLGLDYFKKELEDNRNGFICFYSANSRTLEILAEQGYIEYIKLDRDGCTPIDKVKLIKR